MKFLLSFLFAFIGLQQALAGSSAWFETQGAKIRLIALPSPNGTVIDAGLQIELEKGWKTYWRSPGASGLPPQLDFSGSRNIAATSLGFPVPKTFRDGNGLTAGYDKSITLPIKIEPLFAERPVVINMTGIIGLCEEICVPVQFQLSLTEDGKGISTADVASALFQTTLDKMNSPGDNMKIMSARVKNQNLIVEAKVPQIVTNASLMVEGPASWYLTPVNSKTIENGTALFEVDLRDVPKDADPTSTELTFSLVAGGQGIEQKMLPAR